jgi:hypothetical protein
MGNAREKRAEVARVLVMEPELVVRGGQEGATWDRFEGFEGRVKESTVWKRRMPPNAAGLGGR